MDAISGGLVRCRFLDVHMFSNSAKGQADKYRQQIRVVSVQLGLSWPNLCVRDGLVFYTIVDIECLLWDRRVRLQQKHQSVGEILVNCPYRRNSANHPLQTLLDRLRVFVLVLVLVSSFFLRSCRGTCSSPRAG
jgi:hypothetical protein